MKVLKVEDGKVAKKLRARLLKKGMVVAEVYREKDLRKDLIKKADVVLLLKL
ncbi:hypothetical protein [Hydrogenobacter thermophilus]|uniref:hypothetical protein n=1 Tax=Hydrogenobacter thermophilus TaxID=940 RepID=UPI0030F4D8E5